MVDVATAVVPYAALWVLMYLALEVSYLVVLAIAVPAAGFLLRTYMVFQRDRGTSCPRGLNRRPRPGRGGRPRI
jgi:hypothetical protein